eukprot:TRINITY_DN7112_c0_g1_i1.p1 TRINITY_DN7112_c0_g1~~TRINITY_DN7112_c0_g1_i1.p1  ORF type:complete len:390 (+),score=109.19 TRINITY_DN7112_c0_g1_i1:62-1231(+)
MSELYCWGLGKEGQLGHSSLFSLPIPQKCTKVVSNDKSFKIPSEIVSLGAGLLNSAFVTASGEVYTCGSNRYGRLGHSSDENEECSTFKKIQFFSIHKIKIIQISCGGTHTAAITEEGHVYTWGSTGSSISGELGQGKRSPSSCFEPLRVEALISEAISSVECGHKITGFISRSGNLYIAGKFMNLKNNSLPNLVEIPNGEKVSAFSSWKNYALIVTEDGEKTYCWGESVALGLGETTKAPVLTQIPQLDGKGVKLVSCSSSEHHPHSAAVTVSGELWVWGEGYKGKLGLGSEEDSFVPTKIESDETFVSVSCGGIHSGAISESGKALTWGCGSDGRLGHPRYLEGRYRYTYKETRPTRVEKLATVKATHIKLSYYHTMVLTQKDEVNI